MERQLRLPGRVDVDRFLRLDVALLVVNAGLDDAVPDGLSGKGGRSGHLPPPSTEAAARREGRSRLLQQQEPRSLLLIFVSRTLDLNREDGQLVAQQLGGL